MKVELKDRSGELHALRVVRNPPREEVAAWSASWIEFAGTAGVTRGPTAAWDWTYKTGAFSAPDGVTLALVSDRCEGLMSLSWPCSSRLEPEAEALYLEYVEAAPWNRGDLSPNKRFSGSGPVLLYLAVEESLTVGHAGRLALNSLATAESFYHRAGNDGGRRRGLWPRRPAHEVRVQLELG